MKVPQYLELALLTGKRELTGEKFNALQRNYTRMAIVFNGRIGFGNPTDGADNIDGKWFSVTAPGVANTDFTVTHNLNRTAAAYFVATKDRAVDVYTSPTANGSPTTQIILRATVASAVITLFIF